MAPAFRATTSIFALLAASALLPSVAFAQESPAGDPGANAENDIVITAQRREERSLNVPISVTSLDEQQLLVANVTQLSDAARLVPGLRFDSQGPAVQPTIRGVGTAVTTSGGGPNVGIYVDGFFQSNTYVADFQLMRVRNIQVLRGPQGTLFGRNTTGGAILVTSADPSPETAAEFRLTYARFDATRAQGYLTFGLSDRVAVDVEGLYSYGNGFQTNIVNGNDHIGRNRSWSVRSGIRAELSDNVSVLVRYIHSESDNPAPQLVNAFVDRTGESGFFDLVSPAGRAFYGVNGSAGRPLVYFYAPPGTYATDPDQVALVDRVSFRTNSDTVQATIRADLGFADLTSYSQYRHDLSPYFGDLDVTTIPLFTIFVGPDDETVSQEFLLTSKPGSRLQWTAGLNYFQIRDTWDVDASFGTPFFDFGGSSTLTKSYAAFVDLTYELVDNLFLTAGARFSHDVVTDAYFRTNFTTTQYEGPDGNPVSTAGIPPGTAIPVDDLENDSVTPRLALRYRIGSRSSVYASFTRGYKAGILNVGGLSQVPVEPERINAYELGYKYDDRTLSVEFAGYYYDYGNLQVSSFQNGAAQIRNAASSEIYGLEGQLRYRVSDAFNVTAGAAWTHARYKSFPNAPFYSYCDPVAPSDPSLACGAIGPGSLTQTTIDASGLNMQRAPEFTANLGANYGVDLGGGRLVLSGNLYYSSSFYFDPSEQLRQGGYEVLALRAQWNDPSGRYSIAVFGDNVTNSRYQTQVLFNTLGIGSQWSAPTTYGVSLGANF